MTANKPQCMNHLLRPVLLDSKLIQQFLNVGPKLSSLHELVLPKRDIERLQSGLLNDVQSIAKLQIVDLEGDLVNPIRFEPRAIETLDATGDAELD